MSKRLVFDEVVQIKQLKEQTEATRNAVQLVVDAASKQSLEFSLQDVKSAWYGTAESVVKMKIIEKMGETPTIGGITMNIDKALSMIDLPNCAGIEDALNELDFATKGIGGNDKSLIDLIEVKNGKATINKDSLESRLEQFKVYANSEEEANIADVCEAFINSVNTLCDLAEKRHVPTLRVQHINNVIYWCPQTNKAKIQPTFFLTLAGKR